MKLVSYYQVNSFLRKQRSFEKEELKEKDDNNNNKESFLKKNSEELSTTEKTVIYPNNLNHNGTHIFKIFLNIVMSQI